jgi:hypothetical protein
MWKSLIGATLMASAAGASAQPFTLLIFETADAFAARTDPARREAYWQSYAAFADAAAKAGVMRGGAGLEAEGASVGPAAGPGLVTGGYFVIDVPDLATARQWAAKIPAAGTGRVEVRPHLAQMAAGR